MLRAHMIQWKILRLDSIDSTNLEAMRQARAGAAEGLCVVACEQTAGRGRLNRTWHSPRDAGIYVSIVLRPTLPKSFWPLLPLMTALAVSDALTKSCQLHPDVKWPNDILANDRKLCGILAETAETNGGLAAVVGIGINLAAAAVPPELSETATSIESVTGDTPDVEFVLAELWKAFAERYEALENADGRETIIREWCANSSYAYGRHVRVSSLENGSLIGVTRGLESDGALRVETDDGRIRVVRAGDVNALRAQAD